MGKKQPETESGWRETRNRHPLDLKLRKNGFKIGGRPSRGEAVWSRDGDLFAQSEALRLCREEIAK